MSPYRDRYDQPVQTPTNNSWLNTAEVAELLGETQERIRVLAEHRLIPSTRRDHRFAYPRDQVRTLRPGIQGPQSALTDPARTSPGPLDSRLTTTTHGGSTEDSRHQLRTRDSASTGATCARQPGPPRRNLVPVRTRPACSDRLGHAGYGQAPTRRRARPERSRRQQTPDPAAARSRDSPTPVAPAHAPKVPTMRGRRLDRFRDLPLEHVTPPGPNVVQRYRQTVSAAQVDGSAVAACRVVGSSWHGGLEGQRCVDRCRPVAPSAGGHVVAGCVAGVADVDHLADLGQAQAGGLAATDEVQPGQGRGLVVAVPVGGAFGRREQPLFS